MNRFLSKKYIICGFFSAAAVIFVFFNFIDPYEVKWLPKCSFFELTGLYCPGCGNTRALYYLAHGNILMSIRNNCLLITAVIFLSILLFYPHLALKKSVCFSVLFVVLLFFILRNIPLFPFILLAPV